jgi:stearoyl-CoA desaturase (Delta-9 desaturase)
MIREVNNIDKSQQNYKILNIIGIGGIHILFFYCVYQLIGAKWQTIIFMITMGLYSNIGVTAGTHRLWCHKTYKAKLPLRIFLMIGYVLAGENSIYNWSRDHRIHHKFCDTDADPYNSKRGFWYSHVGWLLMTKNKETFEKGKSLDTSDLLKDPVVAFNEKYFYIITYSLFLTEFLIPYLFWNEKLLFAFSSMIVRYTLVLNGTWSVNSFAHMFGTKPYNRFLSSVETLFVSLLTSGEGWHNYHHTFPYDFKASEYGKYNLTTSFLLLMKKLGQVYETKEATKEMIENTIERHGN